MPQCDNEMRYGELGGCLKDDLCKNFSKPLASSFTYLYNIRLSPEWGSYSYPFGNRDELALTLLYQGFQAA